MIQITLDYKRMKLDEDNTFSKCDESKILAIKELGEYHTVPLKILVNLVMLMLITLLLIYI